MTQPDYDAWFRSYAEAYTRALAGPVEIELIRSFYAETVLALGVDSAFSVANATDTAMNAVMEYLFGFYASIGMHRMDIDHVEVSPLHENHDRIKVFYVGRYTGPDGSPVTIPNEVVYLVQRRAAGPRIFAFIAGDETILFKQHGLIDEDGEPIPRVAGH
ncbi:hypothetical protein [Brevundimonas lenta]|uniref:SnoaL-like domain-containing protein n=1 Tax=Brevundimonas lenta TaxID=424796 RepID=A0A7W6JGZ2_9CAUL|nr:hypothetical protein [Brevundimonas lenta]MBB4083926.1 hypothetical protein [Brevundimonas lenta]